MPPSKSQRLVESILHVVALGFLSGVLLGPIGLWLMWIREFGKKHGGWWGWLPWPLTPQWPPGDPWVVWPTQDGELVGFATDNPFMLDVQDKAERVTQLDRVEDTRRDFAEILVGWVVGQAVQIAIVLVLVWPGPRWLIMEGMGMRHFDTAIYVTEPSSAFISSVGSWFESNLKTFHILGELYGSDAGDEFPVPKPGLPNAGIIIDDDYILLRNMSCEPNVDSGRREGKSLWTKKEEPVNVTD